MSGKETGYHYTKLVTIRGDSRTSGISNTDFSINLGTNLQKVTRVSIPSVVFRNNAYNINDSGGGANNTLGFRNNATNIYTSFEGGWYTTTSLLSAINAYFVSEFATLGQGQSLVLTQDPITNKIEAVYTAGAGPATITMIDGIDSGGDSQPGIWEVLGFQPPLILGTQIATNLPSLGGLSEVYLQSNVLAPGNMFDQNGVQKNNLLAIPVTAAFGFNNLFECKVDSLCEISYLTPRNITEIDFKLVDSSGSTVDLHGANLTINLKIWFNRY